MDEDVTCLIQGACELARILESNLPNISKSSESALSCIDEIVMKLNAAKGKLLTPPPPPDDEANKQEKLQPPPPGDDEANKQEILQQLPHHQILEASSLLQQWLSGGHQFVQMPQLQAPAPAPPRATLQVMTDLMGASIDVGASAEADVQASPSSRRRRREDEGEKTTMMVPAVQFGNTDVPPDDGYTWRKYGQKEILGSNYPRSYFRCTHQKLCQCPAKKQVQRVDSNPNIFSVTYRGSHTCHRSSTAPSSSIPPQLMISQAQSHDITHITAAAAASSQVSPPSTSIPCWLSPVHLGLLASGGASGSVNPAAAEAGGGGATVPSTSRFAGVDYPVADMADAMFNSGSSSGNSMESLFPSAEEK